MMRVAVHSGVFHADDVVAFALIQLYWDRRATVVRTRDEDLIADADMAVDVGGIFDPSQGRFDHHQASYTGNRSSAGMILDHLEATGKVSPGYAGWLRQQMVDYVDVMDIGKGTIIPGVPTFPNMIAAMVRKDDLDGSYDAAVRFTRQIIMGFQQEWEAIDKDAQVVVEAMDSCDGNILFLPSEIRWKETYFQHGGADHPSQYMLCQRGKDWTLIAIPPCLDTFDTKQRLPQEWHEQTENVDGLIFCHKTGFLAVFTEKGKAIAALKAASLFRS